MYDRSLAGYAREILLRRIVLYREARDLRLLWVKGAILLKFRATNDYTLIALMHEACWSKFESLLLGSNSSSARTRIWWINRVQWRDCGLMCLNLPAITYRSRSKHHTFILITTKFQIFVPKSGWFWTANLPTHWMNQLSNFSNIEKLTDAMTFPEVVTHGKFTSLCRLNNLVFHNSVLIA